MMFHWTTVGGGSVPEEDHKLANTETENPRFIFLKKKKKKNANIQLKAHNVLIWP